MVVGAASHLDGKPQGRRWARGSNSFRRNRVIVRVVGDDRDLARSVRHLRPLGVAVLGVGHAPVAHAVDEELNACGVREGPHVNGRAVGGVAAAPSARGEVTRGSEIGGALDEIGAGARGWVSEGEGSEGTRPVVSVKWYVVGCTPNVVGFGRVAVGWW